MDSDGGSGDIFYRDIDDFTLVLEVGKLCVLWCAGRDGRIVVFQNGDDDGNKIRKKWQERFGEKRRRRRTRKSHRFVRQSCEAFEPQRHTVNKSSVSPSSSLRAVRTPNDLGVPKPFATSSQRRQSVPPTVSYKNNKKKQTASRLSLNIRATKRRHLNQSLLIDGREKTR